MKRIVAILLVGIMLLLPSCGKKIKKESATPSRPNSTVTASCNGEEYSAKIHYADTGIMTVIMDSPFVGVEISISDSACQIKYDGMELDYSKEQEKFFCPFIELYPILKIVCYTVPESVKTDGDNYLLKYRTPELSCSVVSSRKDGTLKEIKAEDIKFIFN